MQLFLNMQIITLFLCYLIYYDAIIILLNIAQILFLTSLLVWICLKESLCKLSSFFIYPSVGSTWLINWNILDNPATHVFLILRF